MRHYKVEITSVQIEVSHKARGMCALPMNLKRFFAFLVGAIILLDFVNPPETRDHTIVQQNIGADNYAIIIEAPKNDNLTTAVIAAVVAELVSKEVSVAISNGRSRKAQGSA